MTAPLQLYTKCVDLSRNQLTKPSRIQAGFLCGDVSDPGGEKGWNAKCTLRAPSGSSAYTRYYQQLCTNTKWSEGPNHRTRMHQSARNKRRTSSNCNLTQWLARPGCCIEKSATPQVLVELKRPCQPMQLLSHAVLLAKCKVAVSENTSSFWQGFTF